MIKNKDVKKLNNRTEKTNSSPGQNRFRAVAVAYLARRPYSAFELKQKLKQKGASVETADLVVKFLVEEGLLNEEKLVEAIIFERKNYTLKGRSYIRAELQRRGVNRDLIDQSLENHYTDEEETAVLIRYLHKEASSFSAQIEADEQKRKKFFFTLMRRAAGRGFPNARIYALFEEGKINLLDNKLVK